MTGTLTHARILSARDAGGVVLWDIAVALPGGGEYKPGEIEAGPYVMAAGLIVGFWMDGGDKRKFVPMGGGAQKIRAKITGSSPVASGVWEYEWVQVRPSSITGGVYENVQGGKNSSDHGIARNAIESPNSSSPVQGSGINLANLPSGFAPVPIGVGAIVSLSGPFRSETGQWWDFEVSTHVDGSCEATA